MYWYVFGIIFIYKYLLVLFYFSYAVAYKIIWCNWFKNTPGIILKNCNSARHCYSSELSWRKLDESEKFHAVKSESLYGSVPFSVCHQWLFSSFAISSINLCNYMMNYIIWWINGLPTLNIAGIALFRSYWHWLFLGDASRFELHANNICKNEWINIQTSTMR